MSIAEAAMVRLTKTRFEEDPQSSRRHLNRVFQGRNRTGIIRNKGEVLTAITRSIHRMTFNVPTERGIETTQRIGPTGMAPTTTIAVQTTITIGRDLRAPAVISREATAALQEVSTARVRHRGAAPPVLQEVVICEEAGAIDRI